MATNPVQPPVPAAPTPPHADAHYDEHSGVYGFFRRHQKKLLYTAGLFTLLTFSITGPMTSLANELFSTARPMPTIQVNGKRIPLAPEDYTYGTLLARNLRTALPPGVLPMIDPGEGSQNELGNVFAVLRRAAIAEGIDASMVEVDRAIEALRELVKAPTPAKMARDMSFGSLAQYRDVVREAMRIGTYVRLQTLALDSTEAKVLQQVTSDREKITLRVATFDEKKAEEELKKATPLSEEDLKKWLEAKNEREKRQMQAYDAPRAELRFAALLLAADQFDPEQWKDGYLKDFTVSDEQLQNIYNMEKETRFKLEGADQYKPMDDAAVKSELTRLIQAEHVMNQLMAALRTKQTEGLKPQTDEMARTQGELGTAQSSLAELEQKAATKAAELASKEAELAQKPDDAGLKAAVEALKVESQAAKDASFAASEKIPSLKAAVTAAEEALTAARAAFDFPAAFAELTKDKKGFVQKAMSGKKSGDEMKDLDALGLDLGKWPSASQAAGLRSKGDLGFAPGRTSKAVVLYQATDVEPMPLKPWETLKPLAEGAYWTEQAKKQGEEKKKAMEAALLRLAKEKMVDKVAEIEGKKQARIDEKLAEWESKVQAAIVEAEKQLAKLQAGTQAHAGWQQELDNQKAMLAQKEQRKTAFTVEIGKAIETEIGTEAKKFYREVLDAAAAEAGFTVADVGPHPRDLQERDPRFDKNHEPAVVFLMRSQSKLKEGEATDVLQDFSNRAYHVAACVKVEPLAPTDVTRRDFESLRTGDGRASFAAQQAGLSFYQAFTLKAVEARYALQREVGELREEASANPSGK